MADRVHKPFFSAESFAKYSVIPSLLTFIKKKDIELNGPLIGSGDG